MILFSRPGGIPARNAKGERLLVYLGVIDILQNYLLRSRINSFFFRRSCISTRKPKVETVSRYFPYFFVQYIQFGYCLLTILFDALFFFSFFSQAGRYPCAQRQGRTSARLFGRHRHSPELSSAQTARACHEIYGARRGMKQQEHVFYFKKKYTEYVDLVW